MSLASSIRLHGSLKTGPNLFGQALLFSVEKLKQQSRVKNITLSILDTRKDQNTTPPGIQGAMPGSVGCSMAVLIR